ncbi:MAG: TlyA family RNA methyltransferase [Clostridia bacterium]|nr:TlyA family RNA methyltransferase [Clostridia bacterium]
MRIDKLLFSRGLAKSRESAQRMIRDGNVLVDGKIITKPSFEAAEECDITLVGETLKYVSRGGLKLERALDAFAIDVNGLDCVDIGASTGGFTDCLLKRGASHVRAVDVGRSQLDKTLERDERVTSFEGVNARYLKPEDIGGLCDMAVCDVSFISLTLIMPAVSELLSEKGCFVALIKPQFEAGRANIGKNGIVKDRNIHAEVIERVIDAAAECGLHCFALTASPILGGDGNREYLAAFDRTGGLDRTLIKKVAFE